MCPRQITWQKIKTQKFTVRKSSPRSCATRIRNHILRALNSFNASLCAHQNCRMLRWVFAHRSEFLWEYCIPVAGVLRCSCHRLCGTPSMHALQRQIFGDHLWRSADIITKNFFNCYALSYVMIALPARIGGNTRLQIFTFLGVTDVIVTTLPFMASVNTLVAASPKIFRFLRSAVIGAIWSAS